MHMKMLSAKWWVFYFGLYCLQGRVTFWAQIPQIRYVYTGRDKQCDWLATCGSHCNQCKDLPTFSTVFFCCLHYCITVIYYVLFCLINYFQVQVQVLQRDLLRGNSIYMGNCSRQLVPRGNYKFKLNLPPGLAAVARLLRAACRHVNAPVVFLCFYICGAAVVPQSRCLSRPV